MRKKKKKKSKKENKKQTAILLSQPDLKPLALKVFEEAEGKYMKLSH